MLAFQEVGPRKPYQYSSANAALSAPHGWQKTWQIYPRTPKGPREATPLGRETALTLVLQGGAQGAEGSAVSRELNSLKELLALKTEVAGVKRDNCPSKKAQPDSQPDEFRPVFYCH